MFFEQMHPTWQNWLRQAESQLKEIEVKLQNQDVLPARENIMRAFQNDPLKIRVVILGQDPYPTPSVAIGLAFAVSKETKTPRSLVNIYKELFDDLGITASPDASLEIWQDRGVFLLNSVLTTLAHKPQAHENMGWQKFTSLALSTLAKNQKVICLAWGAQAQKLAKSVEELIVIPAAHPSPLSASRGFFGSKPFSQANSQLEALGMEPIDWSL